MPVAGINLHNKTARPSQCGPAHPFLLVPAAVDDVSRASNAAFATLLFSHALPHRRRL
jgi:hypothetical protein